MRSEAPGPIKSRFRGRSAGAGGRSHQGNINHAVIAAAAWPRLAPSRATTPSEQKPSGWRAMAIVRCVGRFRNSSRGQSTAPSRASGHAATSFKTENRRPGAIR